MCDGSPRTREYNVQVKSGAEVHLLSSGYEDQNQLQKWWGQIGRWWEHCHCWRLWLIPSEDVQNSVAKQTHTVDLLYNYFHRKQNPELEFLKPIEQNGAEDQLSMTEKAIKDACVMNTVYSKLIIEKELNESNYNPEISAGEKVGNKRKRNNQHTSTYDTKFLQLEYDAVKDVTGHHCCSMRSNKCFMCCVTWNSYRKL
ncbi:hypothetical protein ACS0TY_002390 [Phlomoides rotata]